MHVFFLCIFVYSYLLDFYFFSQQDPIDNSTWYLGVILIKYSMMMMMLIINIIIINLRACGSNSGLPTPRSNARGLPGNVKVSNWSAHTTFSNKYA